VDGGKKGPRKEIARQASWLYSGSAIKKSSLGVNQQKPLKTGGDGPPSRSTSEYNWRSGKGQLLVWRIECRSADGWFDTCLLTPFAYRRGT